MVAVAIAKERTPAELRALARRERDGRVSSRLLALANALDGMRRDEAARAAGMDRQTLRDWVHRYNAEGVAGLRDRPRPGRPCALDEGRQAALKGLALTGPKLERDGCVAWRARDLRGPVERRFGVRYSEGGRVELRAFYDDKRGGVFKRYAVTLNGAGIEPIIRTATKLATEASRGKRPVVVCPIPATSAWWVNDRTSRRRDVSLNARATTPAFMQVLKSGMSRPSASSRFTSA